MTARFGMVRFDYDNEDFTLLQRLDSAVAAQFNDAAPKNGITTIERIRGSGPPPDEAKPIDPAGPK